MQEEIENRTVNLMITTTRLTARALISGYHKFEERRKQRAAARSARKSQKPTGKQTVKQLIGQNQGVSSIDIAKTDLKGFEKYARTYGVDYAITKDKSGDVPKYLCFFKARDADAMTAAFNAYSAEVLKRCLFRRSPEKAEGSECAEAACKAEGLCEGASGQD